jgi:alpha-N-acetylglucosaminidase
MTAATNTLRQHGEIVSPVERIPLFQLVAQLIPHVVPVVAIGSLLWGCLALKAAGSQKLEGQSSSEDLKPARDLVARIVAKKAKYFLIENIPADQGRDVFEIENQGRKIVLRGNNGVAIAAALNWYLKYYCHCHFALKARQMNLPDPLPSVEPKVRNVSQDRWRYFLNYCCFGYSLPWYDWTQWEELIDWMALNGINAPLSVTGQEAVWRAAGKRLGFSESDLAAFLAGPPYLPFGWMGCLDGWGGPLPVSWIDRHAKLQRRILDRERVLGMTPLLQGFTGHVPPATAKRFPDARLHKVRWAEWETLMLDPLDPLFSKFASAFVEEQKRLFDTDHLYAADTFIEMTPPSGDTNFLAATARAIYEGIAKADPEGVWVLQGWTFFNQAQFWTQPRIEAFLNAVPDSHLLVLDLFCDVTPVWSRTRAFCGKPWVWCALQNFGDCVYLGGALNRIHQDLPAARRHSLATQLSGIGFVNEGLDYNPVIFDFLFEQSWRSEEVNLDDWVRDYARRVTGRANADSETAFAILKESVFAGQHEVAPAYTLVPTLTAAGDAPYSNEKLTGAWKHLLTAAGQEGDSDAFLFYLVSVTRQALGNYSAELQRQALDAWRARDSARFQVASARMLELIRDLDELLATRSELLLGRWLNDAKRWGKRQQEKDRLEWNARRVVTMWGEQPLIRDYARREWSGMLNGFYLKRWEQFYAALASSLGSGSTFDTAAFDLEIQDWERRWADGRETYPIRPRGDSLAVSRRLWTKYRLQLARSFEPESPSLTTGKPATCSTSLPGFPASLANDGRSRDTNRYWATDVNNDPDPWWQVDFQQPTKISRVVVIGFYGDQRNYGFTVEGSTDGTAWDLLSDQRGNQASSTSEGYTCRFASREIRYLRIRQTRNSANTGRHLVEVLAFDT